MKQHGILMAFLKSATNIQNGNTKLLQSRSCYRINFTCGGIKVCRVYLNHMRKDSIDTINTKFFIFLFCWRVVSQKKTNLAILPDCETFEDGSLLFPQQQPVIAAAPIAPTTPTMMPMISPVEIPPFVGVWQVVAGKNSNFLPFFQLKNLPLSLTANALPTAP